LLGGPFLLAVVEPALLAVQAGAKVSAAGDAVAEPTVDG
jgi:hypothetical protein